ncbi:ADAMTS-like protein 5 isoform X1 [Bubalus bubalis]|uniref:ADAMTS-like protein 5 isoform X1 n=2 Tax=Bubalus bubalis TaxID=89462 RepID=UPI00042CA16A|nr:ADAMTS-like protein 5 isoform X1 [Bubalus bubalis]XP_044804500.2 ADAMTS-like protein 5 isoform X1 [Bubalus bubalis]XP_044804501.2 ADAMTS-like protein 5 isoform X1 [Bubalus bubalis]
MGKLRPEKEEHLAPCHTRRPRSLWNLLLLLWTFLNCGLGGNAQGPGEWTPWGSWSRCSSSCGRGLSVRSRRCIRFPREELCWGDTHEYRLCQQPDCPPGAMPFRDLQCALYNGHPVLGTQKTYQWVPFYGAPNHCDLNCLAVGHDFYHSFGRVLDGTPCSPGAQDLCVAGRCLSAGCDGLLGSDAREDRCGRCGGANDSCLFVQRVFRDAGAFAGYWNVTLIPEGARHIRAAHRSRNHLGIAGSEGGGAPLAARIPRGGRWQGRGDGQGHFQGARADPSLAALMGGDGRYVLNGNWAVSPAGIYEAAGTRVVYTRATGPEETLRAAGPTSEDLLLQVLLQEPNPGIEFEFWLPRERYGPFQAQAQVLGWSPRQPQPREVEPQPLGSPTVIPPRTPISTPEPCPTCPDTRGRAHRLLHYCGSDFVFRARVLGRVRQAQETRYEVRVQLIYKNRSPLRALEYVWAPSRCPCPLLALHRDYLLAARRLISPDGTQDRLLLPHAGYARLWSPAEDSRVRLAARHCPL